MPAEAARRVSLLLDVARVLRSPETRLDAPESDWLRTPRTGAPFAGRTPLGYMLAGGAAAIAHVRAYLEAAAAARARANTAKRPTRRLRSPAA